MAGGPQRISPEAALELWTAYKATGDTGVRNRRLMTVCQIHSQLTRTLRRRLAAHAQLFAAIT